MRRSITDFYGRIIACIEESSNGDMTVTDFSGKILGFYRRGSNSVTDFYGKILVKGGPEAIGILFADKLK